VTESSLADALAAMAAAVVADGDSDDDRTSAKILDAAFEMFCHIGIQRTTMEDVARRAGVSRITVYRRFANKSVLVDHVTGRELRRYFEQFLVDMEKAETAADRLVVGFVSSVRAMRDNPMIRGLMAADPYALIPSTVGDHGRTFATVQAFVAGQLRREQEAGHVSAAVDADLVADLIVRLCASFVMIPSQVVDLDDDGELTDLARQFLVPMLDPAPAPSPGATPATERAALPRTRTGSGKGSGTASEATRATGKKARLRSKSTSR
jgi:AcrR family transcriptional regulator